MPVCNYCNSIVDKVNPDSMCQECEREVWVRCRVCGEINVAEDLFNGVCQMCSWEARDEGQD